MQQHGCKYVAPDPPPTHPTLGWVQKVKNLLFQNTVMLHISTYSVFTHNLDSWGGVKGPNIFSESSHVVNQIKGGIAKGTMQAHYSVLTHTLNL